MRADGREVADADWAERYEERPTLMREEWGSDWSGPARGQNSTAGSGMCAEQRCARGGLWGGAASSEGGATGNDERTWTWQPPWQEDDLDGPPAAAEQVRIIGTSTAASPKVGRSVLLAVSLNPQALNPQAPAGHSPHQLGSGPRLRGREPALCAQFVGLSHGPHLARTGSLLASRRRSLPRPSSRSSPPRVP